MASFISAEMAKRVLVSDILVEVQPKNRAQHSNTNVEVKQSVDQEVNVLKLSR